MTEKEEILMQAATELHELAMMRRKMGMPLDCEEDDQRTNVEVSLFRSRINVEVSRLCYLAAMTAWEARQ